MTKHGTMAPKKKLLTVQEAIAEAARSKELENIRGFHALPDSFQRDVEARFFNNTAEDMADYNMVRRLPPDVRNSVAQMVLFPKGYDPATWEVYNRREYPFKKLDIKLTDPRMILSTDTRGVIFRDPITNAHHYATHNGAGVPDYLKRYVREDRDANGLPLPPSYGNYEGQVPSIRSHAFTDRKDARELWFETYESDNGKDVMWTYDGDDEVWRHTAVTEDELQDYRVAHGKGNVIIY